MNFSESFKIAINSIKANWMRSLLTMLGIIIGVSSVILIIGAGTGARDYIVSMIEDMGSNAVSISVDMTQATDHDYITLEDVDNIKNKVDGVERCSPMLMGFGNATVDKTMTQATAVMVGVNSDAQFAMPSECSYGRFFTNEEYNAHSPVCVIGSYTAQEVFGYQDVVGEYITVSSSGKSMKLKIVGVADIDAMINSFGGSSEMLTQLMGTTDQTMACLFVPCTTLTTITGANTNLSSIFVIAEDGADNDAVGNATVNYLKAAHSNYSSNMYIAQNMATYIELIDVIMSILTTFIACVGAVSLIVGGIGVMNIMLVSVTERTREIGIRKSLGAKTKVIIAQFLTESVILCVIGGLIGVVIGIIGAYGVCALIDIKPRITIGLILIALLFSSGTGLFFGIYPAKKAAKLSPIEALRRD